VKRSYRSHPASGIPGWGRGQGWAQPHLAGWNPLADDGSLPVRIAGSVARWWWPTLALAGFGAVAGFILGHDQPGPNLSTRGLLTIALAATVVVLLTIRRAAGPGPLARALGEYAVVALLAVLLATTGIPVDRPPAGAGEQASATADQRPALVKTIDTWRDRLVGAWAWLAELWRRADQHTTPHPQSSAAAGEAMAPSPAISALTRRSL